MRRRSGFTLVEVLVSMALILFIMSILAGAFGAASQSVSDLKAAGDLAEKLRSATNVIKHDLGQDHFTEDNKGSVRLSDSKFWDRLDPTKIPPPGPFGFFRIYETQKGVQETPGSPALDLDFIPSYVQQMAALHFTIAQHGTRRSNFLTALVPGTSALLQASPNGPYQFGDNYYQDAAGPFSSQYAEVEFFLAQTGEMTDGTTGTGPVNLYALYRREQLAVPRAWTQTPIPPTEVASDYEMSMSPGLLPTLTYFNSMQDLSMPVKRFSCTGNLAGTVNGNAYQPIGPPNPNIAADLLLTDVISFDVRVLAESVDSNYNVVWRDPEFRDIADPQIQNFNRNLNPAYLNDGNHPYIFDTWSNLVDTNRNPANDYTNWNTAPGLTAIPLFRDSSGNKIIILAVQISLRVWDFKTKKTRQVTLVQQM